MRILHILILLGGLAGVFFVYKDYASKEKQRRNKHSELLRRVIEDTIKSGPLTGEEDFTRTDEAPLFRCLAFMREAEENGYSTADTAQQAAASAGTRGSLARLITERLNDNYAIARKLGVFEDVGNVLRMGRGLPPVAKAKGWEDQILTVGHILSPVIAPEAANSLANLVLMPEIVRNMESDDIGGFSLDMSKRWLSDGLITTESHQTVLTLLDRKAKKGL